MMNATVLIALQVLVFAYSSLSFVCNNERRFFCDVEKKSCPFGMSLGRRELMVNSMLKLLTIGTLPTVVHAIDFPPTSNAKAVKNRFGDKLRKIKGVLDDLQQDLFSEEWDVIAGYPNLLRSFIPLFTKYTDSAFPGDDPYSKNLKVALRYEVGRLFGAVERFKRAAETRDIKEAEIAFAAISVAVDRYFKAGDLNERYDPIVSTEKYFEDNNDSYFVFVPPSRDPPKIRDEILVISGVDKGRYGRMIGEEKSSRKDGSTSKDAIIKLSIDKGFTEIKVVPYVSIAKYYSGK